MLQFLVVALLVAGVVGKGPEPVKAEPAAEAVETKTVAKDAESAEMRMHSLDHHDYNENDLHHDNLYLKPKLEGHHPEGPVVARKLPSTGHSPDIAAQDEIIKFAYSPAYYEPVWLLDYRFQKSGGRRYTRGPGGHILILPRSYRHHKGDGTYDYDSMIERLRLKMIAEQNERNREHRIDHGHGYDHEREDRHGYEHDERRYRVDERRERVNPYH